MFDIIGVVAHQAPLLRLAAGSIMAFAFGLNLYVTIKMWKLMYGWRRTAYASYAISVTLAAGINAYIRLDWHLEGAPISFPDWQALLVAPIYLFAGIQGARAINRIEEERQKGVPPPGGP